MSLLRNRLSTPHSGVASEGAPQLSCSSLVARIPRTFTFQHDGRDIAELPRNALILFAEPIEKQIRCRRLKLAASS